MKAKTAMLALVSAAIVSTGAFAQGASDNKAAPATDGMKIEKTDAGARRGPVDFKTFSRMDELKAADTDGDGVLSRAEIEALALKRMVAREADRLERRLDVNKDGKISLDAIEKQRKERFEKLDKNGDGQIDRSEMRDVRKAHKHDAKSGHKGPHKHGKDGHKKGKDKKEHRGQKPQN
ncbi:EF-hand domain-containing protein [Daeguia caeni]|uniref:EF-hand domain-containing protein n=1 Tax=Daeguia caeni TaxID=439612 RepID=A0ABV9H7C2_9HYPH